MKKIISLLFSLLLLICAKAQVRIANTLEYPIKGKVKEVVIYDISGKFSISDTVNSQKRVLTFDKNGNQNEELDYFQDGKVVQFKSIFTQMDAQTLAEKKFDNTGKLFMTCTYKFNANKLIEETPIYLNQKSLIKEIHYKYDKNDNKIEEVVLGTNNKVIENISYTYNSSNQLIQEYGNSTFRNGKTVYRYIAKDIVVAKTYDEKGNSQDQQTIASIYESKDKSGNWCLMLKNGKPSVFRHITYY